MKEEKTYPIYTFSAHWSQDGKQDMNYPKWHEGLPEGRIWNGTSFSKMYKEEKTQEELDIIVKEWWEKLIEKKDNIINPELDYLKSEFKGYETWYLSWFQHETFDDGQTDEEVLQSFADYVDRVQRKNHDIDMEFGDDYSEKYKHGYKALMGAEDTWRWHGAEPDGKPEDYSPAPCRCKFCKEQGVIRIAH